jgi:hypothetical protein
LCHELETSRQTHSRGSQRHATLRELTQGQSECPFFQKLSRVSLTFDSLLKNGHSP